MFIYFLHLNFAVSMASPGPPPQWHSARCGHCRCPATDGSPEPQCRCLSSSNRGSGRRHIMGEIIPGCKTRKKMLGNYIKLGKMIAKIIGTNPWKLGNYTNACCLRNKQQWVEMYSRGFTDQKHIIIYCIINWYTWQTKCFNSVFQCRIHRILDKKVRRNLYV